MVYKSEQRDAEYEPSVIEEKLQDEEKIEKAKKWHFPIGGSVASSATVVNDVVYFGSCDKHMYALSAKDGKLLWKFKTGNSVISSPTVVDGVVYFCGNDGYFYALSKDGELLWEFKMGPEGQSFSSPAVVDTRVIFGVNNGYIYCLNLDGREEWRFRTGDKIVASPTIVNNPARNPPILIGE